MLRDQLLKLLLVREGGLEQRVEPLPDAGEDHLSQLVDSPVARPIVKHPRHRDGRGEARHLDAL
jgi:hypothetical protein